MPTDTFFRLPEEKRARILEGAWSEFTAVPYAEASINRIVQTSRIPRGSFYQYFEDKNDLFLTLIDEIRDQFLDLFHDTLIPCGDDGHTGNISIISLTYGKAVNVKTSSDK